MFSEPQMKCFWNTEEIENEFPSFCTKNNLIYNVYKVMNSEHIRQALIWQFAGENQHVCQVISSQCFLGY